MNPLELAWAAGFFDGEGSVSLRESKLNLKWRKRRPYWSPTAHIGQVEPAPLVRFRDAVGGLGKVYGPYNHDRRGNSRPRYDYVVNGWRQTQQLVCCLWSFLSEPKRNQIRRVFSEWKTKLEETSGTT